ncbi:GntR family transcriptional regulator [Thalassotalea euphylliae]|uniref:GntR family transcriptional regulator n=1 Tax=Thalassotalea euphylliae TaxID=1655234 RepID=UPI0036422A1B
MAGTDFGNKLGTSGLAFLPLYKQVEKHVTQLIVEQRWKPGEMLPSEFQLASEFGVSQGTVRKALNTLTDAKVLNRKQGLGTFVAEHTGTPALYRFFPLVADDHNPELPVSEVLSLTIEQASKDVAQQLGIKTRTKVVLLKRRRTLNGEHCLLEDIYLPYKEFAGIEKEPEIPHTLYHFYQTNFNQTVHKTEDKIKAVIASKEDAKLLSIKAGEPLIWFSRLTKSLNDQNIEYRVTRCRSDNYHYLVNFD